MAAESIKVCVDIESKDNTESGVKSAKKRLDDFSKDVSKIKSSTSKAADSVSFFDKTVEKMEKSLNRTGKTASKFDQSMEKTQRSLSKMIRDKWEVVLQAKDEVTPLLKKMNPLLKGIGGKAWTVSLKTLDMATAPIRKIFSLLSNPIVQAGAAIGIGFSFADMLDTYTEFEATMSKVQALSNATSSEMDALTKKAKEMGAATKFSGTESAEAFTYMAQAGWGVQDMLDGIGGIMSLAAADGLDLASVTDIVSNAVTAFGLKATDVQRFADVMAVASSATNTDVYNLGEAFKYVAPVAGAMKYSVEDVSLALGIMSNNAIKGSMAGTSLKTALANMAAPTDSMAGVMSKYNISLTDTQGNMKSLRGVIDNIRTGLGGLSEAEQTAAASTLFGKEAMAGMLAIINTSEEDYKKLAEQIDNSSGAADKMAGIMQDNLKGAFEELGGAAENTKISWMERIEPYLLPLIQMIEEKIPQIEEAGNHFIEKIGNKIDDVREKIKEFTGTTEWENADFFGKVKISWNELIAEPFSEWWNSSNILGNARDIGQDLGSGISTGLLTLLGITVPETTDEGASIGRAFANGFKEGFDVEGISAKIWDGLKGLFSNAATILPGGKSADLSSFLSAGLLAKLFLPVLSFGGSVVSGISHSAHDGILKKILGNFEVDEDGAVSGKGLKGLFGKIGNKYGGATTARGKMLQGGGAVAGAVIGGTTLISGGQDLYKAFTSDNVKESNAYAESGALKVGGVATGAAAGAAIGSVIPGLGTAIGALIGAGIGGLAGNAAGDSVTQDYEDAALRQQKILNATGYDLEDLTFKSEKLNEALKDSSVTAEEFGAIFQQVVNDDLQNRFGNIKLSLEEIEEAAKKLVFGDMYDSAVKFSEATETADSSLNRLKSSVSSMDRVSWKASLGFKMSDDDITEYKTSIDNVIQSAKDYIEDKHYEATIAISLLMGEEGASGITEKINTMYAGFQKEIDALSTELTDEVDIAIKDGVITADEQEIISGIQAKITSITEKLNSAQTEATMETLKIKYSGADLDYESFSQLQAEIQEQTASLNESYDSALKIGIRNLKLVLSEGAITDDEYQTQFDALVESYHAKISGLEVQVESVQFETLASAFEGELDGILPDIEGSVAEKLSTAMHNAINAGVDVEHWDTATAAKWLGLEGLDTQLQAEIATFVSSIASTLPESMSALEFDSEAVSSTFFGKIENTLKGLMQGENLEAMQNTITSGLAAIDLSPAAEKITANMNTTLSTADYTLAGTAVSSGLGTAIASSDMAQINAGIDTVYANTGTQVNTTFAKPFSTTASVNVMLDWSIINPTADISVNTSGTKATAAISAGKHAEGGFVNGRQLSWVGEEGPEAIIPLVPGRRGRALQLFSQVGDILGLGGYAEGGIFRNSEEAYISSYGGKYIADDNYTEEDSENEARSYYEATEGNKSNQKIEVQVSVSPTFQITGNQDEQSVLRIIKQHMKEMADELGGAIAVNLETVFENMPT